MTMQEAARRNFGHDTTTDEVLEGIDLTGKLALVTGASGGLGGRDRSGAGFEGRARRPHRPRRRQGRGGCGGPELEGRGGLYLEDCHVAAVDDSPTATSGVRSYALDAEAAKRLWTISEQAVGVTGMRGL